MGEIWLARELKLERMVALKVLRADLTQDSKRVTRFRQEARAASALNHPNVCTIYALGDTPDGRSSSRWSTSRGKRYGNDWRIGGSRLAKPSTSPFKSRPRSPARTSLASTPRPQTRKRDAPARRLVKLVDFGLAKLAPVPVAVADAT